MGRNLDEDGFLGLARILFRKYVQRSFQVAHADVLINDQALNLLELMGVCSIIVITAIYFYGQMILTGPCPLCFSIVLA